MFNKTTKEITDKLKISKQYLFYLVNGSRQNRNNKQYIYEPVLHENIHYRYYRTSRLYDVKKVESAIKNLKKFKRNGLIK